MIAGGMKEKRTTVGFQLNLKRFCWKGRTGSLDFLKREAIHSTAIVSHGNFIRALTGIKPKNCEVIEV